MDVGKYWEVYVKKTVNIISVEYCFEHIYMLVEITLHISVVPFKKVKVTYVMQIWSINMEIVTFGFEDIMNDQMSLKEFIDLFTGEAVKGGSKRR